jgi:hypothetical protein
VKVSAAAIAGLVGGIAVSVAFGFVQCGGIPLNVAILLGPPLTGAETGVSAALGFAVHLVASVLLGLGYCWVFERTRSFGIVPGLILAVPHAVVTGIALAALPLVHPSYPEVEAAPRSFFAGYGVSGVVVFFLLHLLYGATVALVYRYGRVRGQLTEDPPAP